MIMITRRREFLLAGAVLGLSGVACGAEKQPAEEDVSAIEDLMREHGVLSRILLIYDEAIRRLQAKPAEGVPFRIFREPAALVRKFVEQYHEKLEENYIFPEFEKHGKLVPLVKVLKEQHAAGRALTDVILKVEQGEGSSPKPDGSMVTACEAFIRMYRPHKAREDTVLFPALRKILPAKQLDELGDKFEDEENRQFGAEGFEKVVEQVAGMERELGIYELAQFTRSM
jgi:hemerythrin-like domain-containing protein